MKRLVSSAAFTIAALAGVGASGAELATGQSGDWRYEVVTHVSPGGAERVACSVATGPASEPTLLLSFAHNDETTPGALSGFVYVEQSSPTNQTPIEASFMVDFAAGAARAPGRVSFAMSPDGLTAQSEAYPVASKAGALLAEMRTADALRLESAGAVIGSVSLNGFAAAYAEATEACNFADPRYG